MRRRAAAERSTNETTLTPPALIEPTGVYTAPLVRQMLGLRQSSLRREIKQGRLRVSKRCGRYYFLGEQLLTWLRAGEMPLPSAKHRERNGTPANNN